MSMETTGQRPHMAQRVRGCGWGLLLAWTGAVLIAPGELGAPWHLWLTGAGAVLLGAAAITLALGARPSPDLIVFGLAALVSGAGWLAGAPVSLIGLVLLGWGFVAFSMAIRGSSRGEDPSASRTDGKTMPVNSGDSGSTA